MTAVRRRRPSPIRPPFEPDFGEDPHSLPRKDPLAQAQKSAFLQPDGVGKFVDTCDPALPCTTDGYLPGALMLQLFPQTSEAVFSF